MTLYLCNGQSTQVSAQCPRYEEPLNWNCSHNKVKHLLKRHWVIQLFKVKHVLKYFAESEPIKRNVHKNM